MAARKPPALPARVIDSSAWVELALGSETGQRVKAALPAADACRQFRLATADAIIQATALERVVEVLTCDAHFQGLPGVLYLETGCRTTRT